MCVTAVAIAPLLLSYPHFHFDGFSTIAGSFVLVGEGAGGATVETGTDVVCAGDSLGLKETTRKKLKRQVLK